MYYLLHRNQLHVSALFIGHLQVGNEKLNKQFACVVYSGEVKVEVGTRSGMRCVVWVVWVLELSVVG